MCSSVAVISGKLYINKSGVKIPTDAIVPENANHPYEALEYSYNLKPDLFIREPDMFRSVIFGDREQRGET